MTTLIYPSDPDTCKHEHTVLYDSYDEKETQEQFIAECQDCGKQVTLDYLPERYRVQ